MGIFDSLQDMLGGAADAVQGPIEDVAGGITDSEIVQNVQDQATNLTEGATDVASSAGEQAQGAVDDITQNFGL